jgi:hypothetical protein
MFSRVCWWFIGCAIPVGLGALSWCLGGNTAWGVVAGFTGLLLFFFGIGMLKHLAEMTGRDFVVCCYIGLCWLSWWGVGHYCPVTTMTVKPTADGAGLQSRIRYDGRLLPSFDRSEGFSFQFRGRLQPELVKVETLGPQGWVEGRPENVWTYSGEVVLGKVPTTFVYIDNKGHDAVELAYGEARIRVAAGARERRAVVAPPLGSHFRLTLDGKEVGMLDGDRVLIDVTGSRSYRLQEVVYTSGFNPAWMNPNYVPDRRSTPDVFFALGHVHKLPREVDYFLTPHPPEITVETFQGHGFMEATRTELVEVE